MLGSTKVKYRKNAQGFYNRHFDGKIPTASQILYVFHQITEQYTAKSFTNLKLYLAFDLRERGYHDIANAVSQYVNVDAKFGNCHKPMKKVKTLRKEDINKITNNVKSNAENAPSKKALLNRKQLIAAVWLAKEFGCRPAEMPNIIRTGPTSFFITGVKKDEFGERGLDRHLNVNSQKNADILDECIGYLKGAKMSRIQDRFRFAMGKLFPNRKKLPTLYVFRHIMGSNLKSSQYSNVEKAYILGHQAVRTLENYGYQNAGSGKVSVKAAVTPNEIQSLVRDDSARRKSKRVNRLNIRLEEDEVPGINL